MGGLIGKMRGRGAPSAQSMLNVVEQQLLRDELNVLGRHQMRELLVHYDRIYHLNSETKKSRKRTRANMSFNDIQDWIGIVETRLSKSVFLRAAVALGVSRNPKDIEPVDFCRIVQRVCLCGTEDLMACMFAGLIDVARDGAVDGSPPPTLFLDIHALEKAWVPFEIAKRHAGVSDHVLHREYDALLAKPRHLLPGQAKFMISISEFLTMTKHNRSLCAGALWLHSYFRTTFLGSDYWTAARTILSWKLKGRSSTSSFPQRVSIALEPYLLVSKLFPDVYSSLQHTLLAKHAESMRESAKSRVSIVELLSPSNQNGDGESHKRQDHSHKRPSCASVRAPVPSRMGVENGEFLQGTRRLTRGSLRNSAVHTGSRSKSMYKADSRHSGCQRADCDDEIIFEGPGAGNRRPTRRSVDSLIPHHTATRRSVHASGNQFASEFDVDGPVKPAYSHGLGGSSTNGQREAPRESLRKATLSSLELIDASGGWCSPWAESNNVALENDAARCDVARKSLCHGDNLNTKALLRGAGVVMAPRLLSHTGSLSSPSRSTRTSKAVEPVLQCVKQGAALLHSFDSDRDTPGQYYGA